MRLRCPYSKTSYTGKDRHCQNCRTGATLALLWRDEYFLGILKSGWWAQCELHDNRNPGTPKVHLGAGGTWVLKVGHLPTHIRVYCTSVNWAGLIWHPLLSFLYLCTILLLITSDVYAPLWPIMIFWLIKDVRNRKYQMSATLFQELFGISMHPEFQSV